MKILPCALAEWAKQRGTAGHSGGSVTSDQSHQIWEAVIGRRRSNFTFWGLITEFIFAFAYPSY